MAVIYVARSKTLSEWGADVGVSKNLFKLGITEDSGKEAVAALNEEECGRASDWTLVKAEKDDSLSEGEALARLAEKEMALDPNYYPRIRGTSGVFRVKPENVENSMLVEKALAGDESLDLKLKPADFAAYLFKNARG